MKLLLKTSDNGECQVFLTIRRGEKTENPGKEGTSFPGKCGMNQCFFLP